MLNKEIYVLHFCENLKENFLRQTSVIIRNFGVWLSIYYQTKLFLMRKSLS